MNTSHATIVPPKILVIDDNPGILFAVKEAFKFKDYDVITLETFSGVDEIEEIAPNIIFLDISLIGHNGREVSQELKSDARTKNIPIIILTAYHNAEELAKEAGADDFLHKPFELEHLWDMATKYSSGKYKKILES